MLKLGICGIVRLMNNFKEGGFKRKGGGFQHKPKFGGDRGGKGGNKFGGGKSGGRPSEAFRTDCTQCHKSCSIPFKPTPGKPVYCSDCFAKKNADNDRGGRNEHQKAPRSERSPRHDRPQAHLNKEMIEMKRQLDVIESRLNRILDVISPPEAPKESVAEVKEEKVAAKKPVTKTAKKIAKKTAKKAAAKKVAKKTAKKAAAKKVAKKVVKKTTKAKK